MRLYIDDRRIYGIISKIDYNCKPVIKYDEDSITGRKHMVFIPNLNYEDVDDIKFERKFIFDMVNIEEDMADYLDSIDGSNDIKIRFITDDFDEEYTGFISALPFKYDNFNYFDAVNIEFTVNEKTIIEPPIMFLANSLFYDVNNMIREYLFNNGSLYDELSNGNAFALELFDGAMPVECVGINSVANTALQFNSYGKIGQTYGYPNFGRTQINTLWYKITTSDEVVLLASETPNFESRVINPGYHPEEFLSTSIGYYIRVLNYEIQVAVGYWSIKLDGGFEYNDPYSQTTLYFGTGVFINSAEWNLLALVYDTVSYKFNIFNNGVLIQSDDIAHTVIWNPGQFQIVTEYYMDIYYGNYISNSHGGMIDNARVYDFIDNTGGYLLYREDDK